MLYLGIEVIGVWFMDRVNVLQELTDVLNVTFNPRGYFDEQDALEQYYVKYNIKAKDRKEYERMLWWLSKAKTKEELYQFVKDNYLKED